MNLADIKTAVTHSDQFHSDDVFASAVLRYLSPDINIVRSRDPRVIAQADLVFDVGGEYDDSRLRFDHHQVGSPVRENGIPYSSFGLLWRKYGVDYCGGDSQLADKVDQNLVQIIDADDNGVSLEKIDTKYNLPKVNLVDVISQLNPLDGSDEGYDTQFIKAVELADAILQRFVAVERSLLASGQKVIDAYNDAEDKRLIILDKTLRFKHVIEEIPEALYVVMPYSNSSKWGVVAVKKNATEFDARKPLPSSWAGLRDRDLAEVTGVPDATFCHKKRFLAIALTKTGALRLADKALEA